MASVRDFHALSVVSRAVSSAAGFGIVPGGVSFRDPSDLVFVDGTGSYRLADAVEDVRFGVKRTCAATIRRLLDDGTDVAADAPVPCAYFHETMAAFGEMVQGHYCSG